MILELLAIKTDSESPCYPRQQVLFEGSVWVTLQRFYPCNSFEWCAVAITLVYIDWQVRGVDLGACKSIIESVDSISRDGPDTPIYIIHYKK